MTAPAPGARRRPIDFVALNDALLQRVDHWLALWLPNGVERNGRWYVGDFDGSPGESANVNMATGQWIDNAAPDEDVGRDLVSLYARIHNMGNGEAGRALMELLGWERPDDDAVQTPAPAPTPGRAPVPAQAAPADQQPGADAPAGDGPADAAAGPGARAGRQQKWRAVVPVPKHAPRPGFTWGYKDKRTGAWVEMEASRTWEYSFEGALFGYVARFERINSDGELVKDTLPRTWCENLEDGRGLQRWHWKAWEAPRPLYVPATLLSDGGRLPVVVVEGEKCAEAGHELLGHEFDFVSWPGGCKTWALAHWGWLMGRTVYLWPDCDAQRERLSKAEREAGLSKDAKPLLAAAKQPGMQAMVHIGALLAADFACTVNICQIPQPGAVADGWDIADAVAQGWGPEKVRAFIRGAVPFVPPQDEARAKVRAEGEGISTPSMAAAGVGDEAEARAWRRGLLEAANGSIKPARENAVLALDGMALPDGRWLPGVPEAAGVIGFNEFTNDVIKLKRTPWGTDAGVWGESDELELGDWLCRAHWLPPMSRQTLEEAVSMVARRHRYHPARARFEALRGQWDGTQRLRTWLQRCGRLAGQLQAGEDESDRAMRLHDLASHDMLGRYLARVGTWTCMAIAARVLQPGCKHDYMLILEGAQGLGKSTLCRLLGGEWFADTGLVLGEKDSYQNLQGVLVYEWGELDALNRAEIQKVKQFISSQRDRFRASFDRRPKDYPRQVVFIGTTNESHYLSDPTGNRRFWPFKVERMVDLAWLRENLEQLFAEAVHLLDAGERFHPTHREQAELFDPQQLERTVENALESAIRRYLYDENQKTGHTGINGALLDELTLADLLTALGISVDKQTAVMTKQASAALGRLGWERGRASGRGGQVRPWVYRRPKGAAAGPAGPGGSDESTGPAQGHDNARAADDCPF